MRLVWYSLNRIGEIVCLIINRRGLIYNVVIHDVYEISR